MKLGRRRRQEALAKAEPAAKGPIYVPVPGGVMGAKYCVVLKEMFTFDWSSDRPRYSRLCAEGDCAITTPGPRFVKVDSDGDYGLFQMTNPVGDPRRYGMPEPKWFRNIDMQLIDGSNEAPSSLRGARPRR